jgi:3-methyladenine DNA glycosylase Mpg
METIKSTVKKPVQVTSSKLEQVNVLQEINTLFLTQYMLEIDANFRLYPIEVEAYYYNETNFRDTCVHQNELQKNFDKLYFHRAGQKKDSAFLYDKGGVDVCLSEEENCFFGILIRSAWINNEEKPVCGSGLLARRIVKHICNDDTITKITEKETIEIRKLEDKSIIVNAQNDKRKKDSIVFKSTRVGINTNNHKEYSSYKLRCLIELKEPYHPFKEKEKVVISYLEDHKEIEVTLDTIKKLLGYEAKTVYEYFNQQE